MTSSPEPHGPQDSEVESFKVRRVLVWDRSFVFDVLLLPLAIVALYIAELRFDPERALRDPASMLMHLIGAVLFVRGLVRLPAVIKRIRTLLTTYRYHLSLDGNTLTYRSPKETLTLSRSKLLGAVEAGDWRRRSAGRRWSPVYLIVADTPSRWYIEVPPVFDITSGMLAEHLMRWRGARDEHPHTPRPATELASKIFDAAASGAPEPGSSVVQHGARWIRRGPYASSLLAFAIFAQIARAPADALTPAATYTFFAVIIALILVPVVWLSLTSRHVRPRRGIALLFTRNDAMMRARSGMIRAPWSKVQAVRIEARATWSILEGQRPRKDLVIERRDALPIHFDEFFFSAPIEAVQTLAEAYRAGGISQGER